MHVETLERELEGFGDQTSHEWNAQEVKLNEGFIKEIENGTILARDDVNTAYIPFDSSNKTALQIMQGLRIDELTVVTSDRQFCGVITEERILREILLRAPREI